MLTNLQRELDNVRDALALMRGLRASQPWNTLEAFSLDHAIYHQSRRASEIARQIKDGQSC